MFSILPKELSWNTILTSLPMTTQAMGMALADMYPKKSNPIKTCKQFFHMQFIHFTINSIKLFYGVSPLAVAQPLKLDQDTLA